MRKFLLLPAVALLALGGCSSTTSTDGFSDAPSADGRPSEVALLDGYWESVKASGFNEKDYDIYVDTFGCVIHKIKDTLPKADGEIIAAGKAGTEALSNEGVSIITKAADECSGAQSGAAQSGEAQSK